MLLEAGLLLVLMPWSAFWDRNYLAQLVPGMSAFIASNYVRGAVTGLGLVNIWVALAELGSLFSTSSSPNEP